MSNLSELLPAGSGAKVAKFVASGTLASGQTVALKTDGQVEVVALTSVSGAVGTTSQFSGGDIASSAIAYDSTNNKILVAYSDSTASQNGKAVVGTVSGTNITFGTPVQFSGPTLGDANRRIGICFNSTEGKFVIAYRDSSINNSGRAITATISGTSVSFGSSAVFTSDLTNHPACSFDSTSNRVVISYKNDSQSNTLYAVVGTISGTNLSFGTQVQFESRSNANFPTPVYDANANKTVIVWSSPFGGGTSGFGVAIVGTVSGTSISFGSMATFSSSNTEHQTAAFDSVNNKIVVAYANMGNSGYGTSIVGTVSGTSISFGTAAVFHSIPTGNVQMQSAYNVKAGKTVIGYGGNNTDGTYVEATVSGTSLSFSSPVTFESVGYINQAPPIAAYDSTNFLVLFSFREAAVGTGDAVAIRSAYATSNNTDFVGITNAAISNSATGEVVVQGGVITNSNLSVALATGAEVNLSGKTQSEYPSIAYDTANNKYVVLFADGNNSEYGTAVVVTVSGTTVSFGTPVVFNSGRVNNNDIVYNATAGQFMIVYQDRGTSNQAQAIIGTVSGTTINFGTEQVYSTASVTGVAVAYNTTLNKYLAGSSASGAMSVAVLSVSGTTISVGTPVALSGTKYKPNIKSNESASSFVITNNKNDNQSEAHLITVSGTAPTVATSVDISSAVSTSYPRTGLTFLENNKFVCVYSESNTNNMYTRTITVSGSSLSLGTASSAFTVDADGQTTINSRWPLFFVSTTEAYLYYQDDTSNFLKYVPIAISSTTATSGTEIAYTSETSAYPGFLYSSTVKQSLSFFQSTNAGQQTAAIAQNGNLVLGTDYFVQSDGSLSTTSSTVPAGRALSATSILLEG